MVRVSGLALVLTGGGARAAYQVGVLHELAERLPEAGFPIVTGVSAGSINAAYLAGHPGPLGSAVKGLRAEWGRLSSETIYGKGTGAWLQAAGRWLRPRIVPRPPRPPRPPGTGAIFDTRPLRDFLAGALRFDGIDANLRSGRLRAMALSATSYDTGRSVTFVHGAPGIPMWQRAHRVSVRAELSLDHVMASSAIPIVFPAVRLNGGYYGDGSVRQTFPLSPAVHLGAERILAIGTRPAASPASPPDPFPAPPSPARAMGLLLDSVFMDHLDADAEVLGEVNRLIGRTAPGDRAPDVRPVDFFMIRPSRDLGAIAAEWSHRLPRTLRLLVQGMGGARRGGADFLSYLVFDPDFTGRLIELGASDARAQWTSIERLVAPREPVQAEAG